jgi:hypothetical protein
MKTSSYNPSPLEIDFANALFILQKELEKHLQDNQIIHVESNIKRDNPMVKFNLLDKDGDPHEIVVRIVQIPDKFLNLSYRFINGIIDLTCVIFL